MFEPAEFSRGPIVGRYALHGQIAAGGMATVHFGRLMGPAGFCRVVAIKRLHPQLARDPEFVSMFLDEVHLAARIQHPNVVATLDAVDHEGEVFLVMEYVHGESLSRLIRLSRARGAPIPFRIAATILCGLLHGLHAAHEARSESNAPLEIVHRDVSPQNVIVGLDGVARVLDFGIAKAVGRLQTTRQGQIKGKMAYLAPESVRGEPVDRRSDVYGAAVVLWETLTGIRLFDGDNDAIVLAKVVSGEVPPLSVFVDRVSPSLQEIVSKGLDRNPARRYTTAREMAIELQERVGVIAPSEVGDWVAELASDSLATRAAYLTELELRSVSARIRPSVPAKSSIVASPNLAVVSSALAMKATAPFGLAGLSARDAAAMLGEPSTRPIQPSLGAVGAPRSPGSGSVPAAEPVSATVDGVRKTRAPRPFRLHWGLAAIGAALLFTTGAVGLGWARGALPPASQAARLVSLESPSRASAAWARIARDLTVTSVAPTIAEPLASASAPSPLGQQPPASRPTRLPTAGPSSPPPSLARNACRPPFTVDSNGIKHFKVECL